MLQTKGQACQRGEEGKLTDGGQLSSGDLRTWRLGKEQSCSSSQGLSHSQVLLSATLSQICEYCLSSLGRTLRKFGATSWGGGDEKPTVFLWQTPFSLRCRSSWAY